MTNPATDRLRRLPKIDRLLQEPEIASLVGPFGYDLVLACVRERVDLLRRDLLAHSNGGDDEDLHARLREESVAAVRRSGRPSLGRAINATGVVLHTGLGRAVLSREAAAAVTLAAEGHCLLEVDPESGERGDRQAHVAGLLRRLTGAEEGLAVNNNAAAVFLAVSALAAGREVVIARGQLVEIGGAFRIPDVIRAAGARLVEVGTTNKVRLSDYREALTDETALILRVHPSNFRMVGFTEDVPLEALVELGRERGLPVMDDLGSGALVDLAARGVGDEPTVHASVADGADVITFSGDKLLGGPQAGLIVGRSEILGRLRRHPLMRVVRIDKLTLAALSATLRHYRNPDDALDEVPTLAALWARPAHLLARAEQFLDLLGEVPADVSLVEGMSQVGGGALPGEELPTTLVAVVPRDMTAGELARRLRSGRPSVWGRVRQGAMLFDVRTLLPGEDSVLARRLRAELLGERGDDE